MEKLSNEVSKFNVKLTGLGEETNLHISQIQSQVQYNSEMVSRFNVLVENKEKITRSNFKQVEDNIQRLEKELKSFRDEQDDLHISVL